ncbi:MAG: hypothetical protein A3I16_18305 [Burkholderiales bacterium RIFCSPLOWO2_02_FULL_66_35]|nr:MAG: hypothetical protein A3I16_18305 [Burkholderiales bacterium RIFCSPLOWO2_02_FULL_66_35]
MAVQVNGFHFWLHWLTKLSILLVSSLITGVLREIGPNVQETSGHIGSTHFSYVELEDGVVACVVSALLSIVSWPEGLEARHGAGRNWRATAF